MKKKDVERLQIEDEKRMGIRNPEGLTQNEFLEKHKDIFQIARICWYFGCQPEQIKEELKLLLKECAAKEVTT